ncbi:MAG: hypothetical protein ACE5Q6_02195 [Dehalococcoidia bacterium]
MAIYDEDREQGIAIAQRLGATETATVIRNKQSDFHDIFSTAISEKGLDALAAELITGPPVWAHAALLTIPDLGAHRAALLQRAAEAPDGTVSPASGTTAAVEDDVLREFTSGGPCSKFDLHDGLAADCRFTAKWMDGGAEQPTSHYPNQSDWLWSHTLTAGCHQTIDLVKFGEKVPNSPLRRGDDIWIYVDVIAGNTLSGKNLFLKFTYDPGSTLTVFYVATGTTTINRLSVSDYK